MRWLLAFAVAFAVVAMAQWRPGGRLDARLAPFVDRSSKPESATDAGGAAPHLSPAVPWIVVGGFVGALVAQGDLFLTGPGRSIVVSMLFGALAGYLVWRIRATADARRKDRRYRLELPIVTDALAMQVVSGESIGTSIEHVAESSRGEVSDGLRRVLRMIDSGTATPDALEVEAEHARHPDGKRLLETLAHAHAHGGRLADSLADLSTDFRAGMERDVTSEGGRRAVAAHGPVLALMVPTALLFLLYPTLVGLRALSGAP